jgi:hypothetical protein
MGPAATRACVSHRCRRREADVRGSVARRRQPIDQLIRCGGRDGAYLAFAQPCGPGLISAYAGPHGSSEPLDLSANWPPSGADVVAPNRSGASARMRPRPDGQRRPTDRSCSHVLFITATRHLLCGFSHDVGPDPTLSDVRREPVGNFVGRVDPDDPVGSFASVPRLRRQGAGAFAGHPDRQRQGSFGDHDLGHAA